MKKVFGLTLVLSCYPTHGAPIDATYKNIDSIVLSDPIQDPTSCSKMDNVETNEHSWIDKSFKKHKPSENPAILVPLYIGIQSLVNSNSTSNGVDIEKHK